MDKKLPDKKKVENLAAKYMSRLNNELNPQVGESSKQIYSREYIEFKQEYIPKQMDWYEKACNFIDDLIKLEPGEKKAIELEENIRVSHLNITPSGAYTLSLLAPAFIMVLGVFIGFALPIITGTEEGSLFFMAMSVFFSLLFYAGLNALPNYFASSWRMKASGQMVQCIFYIVTFMRHTSNLELAIRFAGDHLGPPLALDLKKVIWDVETQKYESVKESVDNYLESWKKWNMEFIEAFHLVEASLYESDEARRLEMLDKSLDVILSETYEKMLRYAHGLKSPITTLIMIGVILPILFLVILPLAINFVTNPDGSSVVKAYHIATLYNILVPAGVFFLGKKILSSRPTGYGGGASDYSPDQGNQNVNLNFMGVELNVDPKFVAITIFIVLFFIGISPLIMYFSGMNDFGVDLTREDLTSPCKRQFCMLEYKELETDEGVKEIGPFGLGSTLISILTTLSFSISLGVYFSLRSKDVIEIRNETKKLEEEFASALFQLGNRIGDGLPPELAFGKVASVMEGTISGNFFGIVSSNIRRLGMSVENAIFNKRTGALVYYPSNVIESSMKVLLQSVQKGPKVAAQALVNVSRYIKEIHSVNERLKDLMADVMATMKSQINFLTPVIAGIVIGITSMISNIMSKLAASQARIQETVGQGASVGGMADLLSGTGIPTFYFQTIIGLYVVQIIYILTVISNDIENGEDKLAERDALGKNLLKSVTLYCGIAFAVIMAFNIIASEIIRSVGGV